MRDPAYDVLFEPVPIGALVAKNRFFQVPHCNGMGYRDPRACAEMRAVKAQGGWAVVCTEEAEIHYTSEVTPYIEARIWDDADIPALAVMAERVHDCGALAGIELAYNGLDGTNLHSRVVPQAPSALPVISGSCHPVQARAMTKRDIANLRRWHRQAVDRSLRAGFDLVYVYSGHSLGATHHFLSRRYNHRGDEYGGSLRNRMRLLRELLEDAGAVAVELPAIAIAPPEDFAPLDDAVSRLSSHNWVIFASVNAVDSVFERLDAHGRDARAFGTARVGAIGPATAAALKQRGIRPDFTPSRSVSSAALEELADYQWTGVSVLLPAADIGRDELADGLSQLGANVERVTAYRTITPPDAAQRARDAFAEGIDIVTFTSSSTVRNLLSLLDDRKEALSGSLIACIGPVTSGTAHELGLRVDIEADEHTVEGLAAALSQYFSST